MKRLLMVLLGAGMMIGCNSESPKPAPTEKPQAKGPELVTGRIAFQKLYIAARGWVRDAQPYRLESQATSDANGRDGKADIWHAGFASMAQHSVKPYYWCGTDLPDAPARGVTPGTEDNSYNPSNSNTLVFDMAFLKKDSDKAFDVAQSHGGDKILEKNPDAQIVYQLEWNRITNELTWHVIYNNQGSTKLRVAVNASTGEFIRVEK